MAPAIFCICINPVRTAPMADGGVPTCRENPIFGLVLRRQMKAEVKRFCRLQTAPGWITIKVPPKQRTLLTDPLVRFPENEMRNVAGERFWYLFSHLSITTETNKLIRSRSRRAEKVWFPDPARVQSQTRVLWMLLWATSIWSIVCFHGWLLD